jgi:inorganic pyrophosphatase
MILDKVNAGREIPNDLNVIIEIPANADPVKYEIDKETGALFVDRFLGTAMHYPCNYGYIPNTLCEDGDPLDVLVVTPFPLVTGCVVRCRPLGLLNMTDEKGEDAKLVAVPIKKQCPTYEKVESVQDLPKILLDQIAHFFEHYKDLEPGKWAKIGAWGGPLEAEAEIRASVKRYEGQAK